MEDVSNPAVSDTSPYSTLNMERSDSVDSLEDLLNNLNDDSDESFTEKVASQKEIIKETEPSIKTNDKISDAKIEVEEENVTSEKIEDVKVIDSDLLTEAIECVNPNVISCDNKLVLAGVTETESSDYIQQPKDVKSSRSHSISSHLEEDVINQFLDKTTEDVRITTFFVLYVFNLTVFKFEYHVRMNIFIFQCIHLRAICFAVISYQI